MDVKVEFDAEQGVPISLRRLLAVDQTRFERLLAGFVAIYDRAFPVSSEREDPHAWRARLGEAPPPSEPWMDIGLLLSAGDGGERVLGGVAFEHYARSRCGLVTYLVVDERERGRGHARRLLGHALGALRRRSAERDEALAAVFAETEWPDRLDSADVHLVRAARRRLAVLARLGARVLWDVDYVQPQLAGASVRARHLRLILIDDGDGGPVAGRVRGESVRAFLLEFYEALGVADVAADPDLQRMVASLGPILEALRMEAPVLASDSATVCLHWVCEDGVAGAAEPCPVFCSMERDLLSYNFQEPPPFVTHCVTRGGNCATGNESGFEIEVRFPSLTRYRSEGRDEVRLCGATRRRLRGLLSCTRFHDARIAVWHLALRPAAGEWFDEYDLIKLIHLYDGVTEETRLHEEARFTIAGREPVDVGGMLSAVARLRCADGAAPGRPVAGTVELIDRSGEGGLLAALESMRKGQREAARAPGAMARIDALCGVVTGIFDFDEIDLAEAEDTLTATLRAPGSFMRLHRRTLVYVADQDRALDATRETVGISPYLIIPHAVLIFNEALLREANREADRVAGLDAPSLDALTAARALIDENLNALWLPNVFNYDTERTIYARGLAGRGAIDRQRSVRRKLQEIESWIAKGWQIRRDNSEMAIAILLMWISLVQIKDPVYAAIEEAFGIAKEDAQWQAWLAFGATGVLLSLAIVAVWRHGIPRMREAKRRSRASREVRPGR